MLGESSLCRFQQLWLKPLLVSQRCGPFRHRWLRLQNDFGSLWRSGQNGTQILARYAAVNGEREPLRLLAVSSTWTRYVTCFCGRKRSQQGHVILTLKVCTHQWWVHFTPSFLVLKMWMSCSTQRGWLKASRGYAKTTRFYSRGDDSKCFQTRPLDTPAFNWTKQLDATAMSFCARIYAFSCMLPFDLGNLPDNHLCRGF